MPRDFRCAVDVTASWCYQSGRRGDRKSLKHHMNWSLGAGTEASSGWRELELGIFFRSANNDLCSSAEGWQLLACE